MQFLTQAQCDEWLKRNGRSAPELGALRDLPREKHQNLENASARSIYHVMSVEIRNSIFDRAQPVLLVVHDYAHWSSNQQLLLYSLIRRHFFNTSTMEETPGHLAEPHEYEFLEAIAFLCFTYGWGFYIACPGGDEMFVSDHHGWWGIVPSPSIRPF